ncbi:hypothetical protein [Streptomyces sp. AcH 505]|uniref:hypothetical protein n=1 Tax=Streptomyces sp. AcH 505 TaxID=352211 RepID=UPI0005A74317
MPVNLPPAPPRIARLPLNPAGYPIPWFVAVVDGVPDFRVADTDRYEEALQFGLCWMCGRPLGSFRAFVLGPMCAVNRVAPEPPSHRDCATYAACACPFLTRPDMTRRTSGLPEDLVQPGGVMIRRNPGVTLVWVTRRPQFRYGEGLFDIGQPIEHQWYAEGRRATRAEVWASIESGLTLLRESAADDEDPAASLLDIERHLAAAMPLLPAEPAGGPA